MVDCLVATGFLRTASDPTYPGYVEPNEIHQVLSDTLQIVGSAFLGLTIHSPAAIAINTILSRSEITTACRQSFSACRSRAGSRRRCEAYGWPPKTNSRSWKSRIKKRMSD